jgi:aspartyl-tRNA(Asn)/glutamyl-tRNA(Gln) amidotransferase subunit A
MMDDPWGAIADLAPDLPGGEGPLAGLRIGIKSNIAVAGLPWTAGMGTRRAIIADRDAEVVTLLRAAGATIAATLNMHEAALGAVTDNAFYGRTHNPHRHGFTPGGSSGGSGAAVAGGLVDAALGTDTLGSIRIPAAYCGVYGLKPTLGAVPAGGLVHLGRAFDVIGPLARSLDVLERVWAVIGTTIERPSHSRVLVLETIGLLQPAVQAAYDRAVAALGPVAPLSLADPLPAIRLAALVELLPELLAELGDARDGPGVSDELKAVIAAIGRAKPAPEVLARTSATLVAALGDDAILVLPAVPQAAFAHGARAPSDQADFTALASVAGLPAIAIPAGVDADRLPIGIQIVGPVGSETRLIDLARKLEPQLGGAVFPGGLK